MSPMREAITSEPLELTPDKRCRRCAHWVKRPPDPNNLGAQIGECRQGPPALIGLMVGPGQLQIVAQYPPLPGEFMACGQFALAKA